MSDFVDLKNVTKKCNFDTTNTFDVFALREQLVGEYDQYINSFINVKDSRIKELVEREFKQGLLWPGPLVQINPAYKPASSIGELVGQKILHPECSKIFRKQKKPEILVENGEELNLYQHQDKAIQTAKAGHNYILTSGTGSGKSLAYIIPIVNHILLEGPNKGIKAIIVYPMNALVNSQVGELEKFINFGYPNRKGPVSFAAYTGQESDEDKEQILSDPPDILLTI